MGHYVPNLLFSDAFLLPDIVVEFSALHVLEYEYDAILLLEDLVDVDDIGMVKPHQHFHLILGREEVGLVEFGREHLPAVLPHCPLHRATRPVCLPPEVRPIISYNS
jgi:hypothetical protein